MLHRECKNPHQQKRWCPYHEQEVGPDEIVKGWEVSKGDSSSSRKPISKRSSATRPRGRWRSRCFVPEDEVDPIWFDRTYYLVPAAQPAARGVALRASPRVRCATPASAGLGRFVQAGKEKHCLSSAPRVTRWRSRRSSCRGGRVLPGRWRPWRRKPRSRKRPGSSISRVR